MLIWLMACTSVPPADLLVTGDLGGTPQTVVVRGERIEAVLEPAEAEKFRGPQTESVEADRITAGFVDAHGHPYGLGKKRAQIDLVDIATYAATLEALKNHPGTGWILGRGWDQNDWKDVPESGWPSAADLDAVTQGRPAALRRVDGHAVWVNSAALASAGVTADTPNPEGGEILRDADGSPSGILVDTAMSLVPLPRPEAAEVRQWALDGTSAAREAGLTGVHVMGASDETLAAFQDLADSGELPIRLWVYVSPKTEAHNRLLATGPWGEGRLKVVGVKAFADGALGSRGAWLTAEYADRPGHVGSPITTTEQLGPMATDLVAKGAQLAVHAIGDQGVRDVLDGFAIARSAHPDSEIRLRVEHAQVVHPDDVGRFSTLNAIASMQPTHATSDMPWAQDRLGEERIRWAYAWKTLEGAGAKLAFGSDFPVESHEPRLGMHAATKRTDLAGEPKGGWYPDQAMSEAEAIAGFTAGAAYAVHEEDSLGVVAPGMLADLTLWTSDFTPVGTVVGGEAR